MVRMCPGHSVRGTFGFEDRSVLLDHQFFNQGSGIGLDLEEVHALAKARGF